MKTAPIPYYLGLDIGTNSVGYAVTDEAYQLQKTHGDPIWGSTTFDDALPSAERRAYRTARRRLDRRQQRVQILEELFAPEISKIDPNFFVRRRESALFADDATAGVRIFEGGLTDKEYHQKYPTIHHLIVELMENTQPHDVRLVFLACAWLVANRGHFLFDASADKVGDFSDAYQELKDYFGDCGYDLPWDDSISTDVIQSIMEARQGVREKQKNFIAKVFSGKKPSKQLDEAFPYSRDAIVVLLSGGKAEPKDLFQNEAYGESEKLSLDMDEDNFARILGDLGDDAELLLRLRRMYDCAVLNVTLDGRAYISETKVAVYEQHKKDLKWLKAFVKKYKSEDYSAIFREARPDNYVAYSYHTKSCRNPSGVKGKAGKEAFGKFLSARLKDISVSLEDKDAYDDMMKRLELRTFLPKQKDTDNRVIPQQLYRKELVQILDNAGSYLPVLEQKDADGLTMAEKILSVFSFRIPYFVGPLNPASEHAWIVRNPGRIYPWNFEKIVDLDASEKEFIRRMVNRCTYLPGEEVLPLNSLLYSKYVVLNELNNLKINQQGIPVGVKQELFHALFEQKSGKVTLKTIEEYLRSNGYLHPGDEISGIDGSIKHTLKTYHSFRRLMESECLTEEQVEDIVRHAAYSEDKNRMSHWLNNEYPQLSQADRKYILGLKLKEFGRLSGRFLNEIEGTDRQTGEVFTVIEGMWKTNSNLMQLLSDRYTFRQAIDDFASDYYSAHKKNLSDRLDDMYISNAVKRPILRALDVTGEVVKAMGRPPARIFVEMARGATPEQRGKRTQSRRQQILDLYARIKTEDTRSLMTQLEGMGDLADNRLQSDKLFLYFMQMGKCMYTGEAIDLSRLASKAYDIDHIYPQSKVKDDSILNNKVLVLSDANGAKGDSYPVSADIQSSMRGFWDMLKANHLITEEKHRRLIRTTRFTADELHQFIARQLVETRQSTKAVAQLLEERYPDTKIVYVKAGMVSEFRSEFELLKSRMVNDLHHAKDAYLNIVVGNVYYEKFTRRFFNVNQNYSVKIRTVFTHPVTTSDRTVWQGESDLAKVKKVMSKNAVHLTRYAFCRKGGLFDQMPLKARAGLMPKKAGMDAEKYGGYKNPTASFYMLAAYQIGEEKDLMFVPVELMYADRIASDPEFAAEYIRRTISEINGGKQIDDIRIMMNGRRIKINSVLELDGMRVTIRGKSNKGVYIIVSPVTPLILGQTWESYVKRLERYTEKKKTNPRIVLNEEYDHISPDKNVLLYQILSGKLTDTVFKNCPGNIAKVVKGGETAFSSLSCDEQVACLCGILSWFGAAQNCDLTSIGGSANSGKKLLGAKCSSWRNYTDVRIIDSSASGLFEKRSANLLTIL